MLDELTERQLSDETRLRRVVAFFQRELGAVFGNARVLRRNRRYEVIVAVYEKQLASGRVYRMPSRQIMEWIRQAANKAHPRLYKRMTIDIRPWKVGGFTHKQFAPVFIQVDAAQSDVGESVAEMETS